MQKMFYLDKTGRVLSLMLTRGGVIDIKNLLDKSVKSWYKIFSIYGVRKDDRGEESRFCVGFTVEISLNLRFFRQIILCNESDRAFF